MADAGCSYHYESAEERVREVRDESTYENIGGQQQTASEPQPSTTKNKPRSLVFVSVIAASLLVLFGLAIAGIILVSQEKLRLDEAKEMYDNAVAELRGQDQKLNDSLLEKLQLEVEELRAQDRKLVKELGSEVKQLRGQDQKLNDSLIEKLEFEAKDSSRILQQMIQKQASKQNQTINDLQRLIQHNEMRQNRTHLELLRGATSCAELRDKYGVLESGIYQMKQSGSRHPVYTYCNFQLRTGLHTCDTLLKGLGTDFEAAYFWLRESATAQPNFKFCLKRPSSCKEFANINKPTIGRTVNIFPTSGSLTSKTVYCDTNGWTVFQRRQDGSVNFSRGWDEYVKGFGDMKGEFWLGLETIYQFVKDGNYELRVDLEDFYGKKAYAEYGQFYISSASDEYRLAVSSYSGNAGDSLAYHNGMRFTTKDNDNDESIGSCAISTLGAWWYNSCQRSNLNSKYRPSVGTGYDGIEWRSFKDLEYLKSTVMKFRKKN